MTDSASLPLSDADGVDAIRADGGLVRLRPVVPDDAAALLALHRGVSDRSLYLRFFGISRPAADRYVAQLVRPAGPEHQVLSAWIGDQLVGVAAFERLPGDTAEVALLVSDDRHHEGIGTLLLEHLAGAARQVGITHFVADVLGENSLALQTLRDMGCRTTTRFEDAVARVEISLQPDATAISTIDERERFADEASLRHVLQPRSIAVIGAGERSGSVGHEVLRNLLEDGYTGTVYAVNPRHQAVLGVPCLPSPAELPEAIDLAVVAVPHTKVAEVAEACGARQVRAMLILTAGFAETGEAGAALQRQVVAIARYHGMRIVGPNCVGLLNTDPALRLNATFAQLPMRADGLSLASQSGALGIAVLEAADRAGLGVAQFISVGNKADVSGNDLLLAWERDERTRVIALYLESLGNPRKFARIARRVANSKPIIAIKSGRSIVGQRAGRSHTAAAATSDVVVDALFVQAGVLRVDTMQEMIDAARVLCDQPLPAGRRVVVVGNSGGPGVLAADAADAAGLTLAELTASTREKLSRAVPDAASVENPVDLGATASPAAVGAALQILLDASEIDAALTVLTDIAVSDPDAIMSRIASVASAADKPVVATRVGSSPRSMPFGDDSERALPVFTFPEPAASALALAARYAQIRSARPTPITYPDGVRVTDAAIVVQAAGKSGASWLSAPDVHRLLTDYGLPMSPQRVITGEAEAVLAAADFGYPLAVKLAEGGVHKTDVGGVVLDVADEVALRRAVADLMSAGGQPRSLLLQPMSPPGTELVIGAVQHDRFGPVAMIGSGGVFADLVADRAFRLAPLSSETAAQMIGELRMSALLDGDRGSASVSREALSDLVVRVAALVDDLPAVAELDLNPVICQGDRLLIVDARVRLGPPWPRLDQSLRRLPGPQ